MLRDTHATSTQTACSERHCKSQYFAERFFRDEQNRPLKIVLGLSEILERHTGENVDHSPCKKQDLHDGGFVPHALLFHLVEDVIDPGLNFVWVGVEG